MRDRSSLAAISSGWIAAAGLNVALVVQHCNIGQCEARAPRPLKKRLSHRDKVAVTTAKLASLAFNTCAWMYSFLVAAIAVGAAASAAAATIRLNGSSTAFEYHGHGALSAGASSRLLMDYPEPQRSDILDLLFKPRFGAALHTFKFEIGGDTQSTDGTEPSFAHTRVDVRCDRGYEYWLLSEAKQRNPAIKTYALSWGIPRWVGDGSFFSADNIAYQVSALKCIHTGLNVTVDYIGIWNEMAWGTPDYVKALRVALDAAGLRETGIVLPDYEISTAVAAAIADPNLAAAVAGFGAHYPLYPAAQTHPEVFTSLPGKFYWASEDYSTVGDWAGAACWGRTLNVNYVTMNMTASIAWSLLWSVYPGQICDGQGLMFAFEPWSGHYTASGPLWTTAHTTQFTQPGWTYLSVGGGAGKLPGGGSYVTLVPPSGAPAGMTLVVESLQGKCLRAPGVATVDQNLTFALEGGLPGPGTTLQVWRTTAAAFFVRLSDVQVAADGTLSIFQPADSITTVSTVTTAAHGATHAVPSPAAFPLPYADDFSGYADDAIARYFADMGGSWAVRGGRLVQTVPADPGPNSWAIPSADPFTYLGDAAWTDVLVTGNVKFAGVGNAALPPLHRVRTTAATARLPAKLRGLLPEPVSGDGVGSSDEQALALVPCNALDDNQLWAVDAAAPRYISLPSTWTGAPLCLGQ